MSTGVVIPNPKFTGFDNDGDPLAAGLLYAYAAGTTTDQDTYSDVGLTTPNANPVVLDSAGRATVYLTPATAYKFVLKTAAGVTLWTQDNVTVAAAATLVSQVAVAGGLTETYTGATTGTGVVTVSAAAIQAGGIAIASQAALDLITAASATQLARTAASGALAAPRLNAAGNAWEVVGQARASAYNSASQTVNTGATDAITLDTEDEDVGGLHSTSTNTNRMTIVVGGVYLVIGRAQVESVGAASARLYLRVDGTAKVASKVDAPGAALPSYSLEVTGVFLLTAGQYIDMAGEAVSANCVFGSSTAAWAARLIVARIA